MLMCWCIGKAARNVKEFYLLPVGGKLMQYDTIAVNTIVANREGEVSSCDIPFCDDLSLFNHAFRQVVINATFSHLFGKLQIVLVKQR